LTLVDTNVLLDLLTRDPAWAAWSVVALNDAALAGPVLINDIVYGELAVRFDDHHPLDEFVDGAGLVRKEMPRSALFLAAKAHQRYRAAGGTRTGVLSDFFIGAHALALDVPILTRDVSRYRSYFPEVRLIAPRPN
jgi:predicted nucleic acid-binding protein